jgi:enoyl-CoA hydratase
MTDILLREDSDGICTLTLNRPDKLNALDTALFRRLDVESARLEAQGDSIGCVVLRGSGRAFCAGADLAAMSNDSPPPPTFKPGVIERMSRLPQAVIACVHGTCVTGGLELALAADFIVAGYDAKFADTHGRWGMVAGWGMTQRLPRRIGVARAKLMMMTGRFVAAAEALQIGLVDLCVPDDQLQAATVELAHDIMASSRHTVRETKRLLRDTEGLALANGLAHEHYRHPGLAPDFKERLARFGKKK